MSKKKKDVELRRLRREVEVLRAQLKDSPTKRPKQTELQSVSEKDTAFAKAVISTKHLKRDLTKTGLLSLAAFGIIATLALTQSRWTPLLENLSL